jgi:hypothetical protein
MGGNKPLSDNSMNGMLNDLNNPTTLLDLLRKVRTTSKENKSWDIVKVSNPLNQSTGMFDYLHQNKDLINKIHKDVKSELNLIANAWVQVPLAPIALADCWDEWLKDFIEHETHDVRAFVDEWGNKMKKIWTTRTGTVRDQVMADLEDILNGAAGFTWDFPTG